MYLDQNGIAMLEESDNISPFQVLMNSMQSATSEALSAVATRSTWVNDNIFSSREWSSYVTGRAILTTISGLSHVSFRFNLTDIALSSGGQKTTLGVLIPALRPPQNVPMVGYGGNDTAFTGVVESGGDIVVRWSSGSSGSGWSKAFTSEYPM